MSDRVEQTTGPEEQQTDPEEQQTGPEEQQTGPEELQTGREEQRIGLEEQRIGLEEQQIGPEEQQTESAPRYHRRIEGNLDDTRRSGPSRPRPTPLSPRHSPLRLCAFA